MELNFARRDPDFRVEALTHMIEIYLNPDPNAGLEALDPATEPLNDPWQHGFGGLDNCCAWSCSEN